ncbi:MAG: hypothetical protein H0V67_06360 [Geodermatophilaceae bacterium]|nr:hypothetical protein [Geodermatophilaceae bacterium]
MSRAGDGIFSATLDARARARDLLLAPRDLPDAGDLDSRDLQISGVYTVPGLSRRIVVPPAARLPASVSGATARPWTRPRAMP